MSVARSYKSFLIYWLYLVLSMFIMLIMFFNLIVKKANNLPVSIPVSEIQETDIQEALVITPTKIKIPSSKELEKLEENYKIISNYLTSIVAIESEITKNYEDVTCSQVCSIANRNFNILAKNYTTYQTQVAEISKCISLYEEEYNKYLELILGIPKSSSLYNEKYKEFMKRFSKQYETVSQKKYIFSSNAEKMEEMYIDAKRIADEFFEEYFDIMCHIVNAESGICPPEEQCYVANVLENRVKSSKFPNTIHDVVFQPGQYEPTWNGSYYKTPSALTVQTMEEYLRGNVETGMPDNVFYQALFRQGKGVWKHMPSGHYFCY